MNIILIKTRVLTWYCKCHDLKDIKNYKDIIDITKVFDEHFQYNESMILKI